MLAFIAVILLSLIAQRPADVVKWSASAQPKSVAAGGEAKITLKADIESGWKLYAISQPKGGPIPLSITAPKDAAFRVAEKRITAGLPKVHKDENFNADTQYYEDEAVFTVPVTVPKTAAKGTVQVPLDVTFQACGANICLRPFTQRVTDDLTVAK